jgi:hypothetical protein
MPLLCVSLFCPASFHVLHTNQVNLPKEMAAVMEHQNGQIISKLVGISDSLLGLQNTIAAEKRDELWAQRGSKLFRALAPQLQELQQQAATKPHTVNRVLHLTDTQTCAGGTHQVSDAN